MSKPNRKPAAEPPTEKARQTDDVEIPVNGIPIIAPSDWKAVVPRVGRKADASPLAEMTIARAADYLGVPRAFVIKLIKKGELPCRMAGKRRRIPTPALEAQKEKMFEQAKKSWDEVSRMWQDLGVYEDELGKKER